MSTRSSYLICLLLSLCFCPVIQPVAFSQMGNQPFYITGEIDAAVPSPKEVLGYQIGEQPTRYRDLVHYFHLLAEKSPRVKIQSNGETYEGRKLYQLLVSTPENLQRLDAIKADAAKLGDPRTTNTAAAKSIIQNNPAIAWMFYTIHGNELSGSDASIALAYRLAAGTDAQTMKLLKELVIGIYPMENPDGRERYLEQMEQWDGNIPSHDAQTMQHSGLWPGGRTNHYFFDLNRDWFILSQPESRSRTQLVVEWNPQLVVDAHEMGPTSTYLFNPPREPVNHNVDQKIHQWWQVFSHDQAAAFDKNGWSYYTGEWYEDWYPGYGSSYPCYRGTVSILYEQASTDGSAIQKPNGQLSTFHDAVNHQFTSCFTNLTTAADNRQALLQDFYDLRRKAVNGKNKNGVRAYILDGQRNPTRTRKLVKKLLAQKIEVYRTEGSFTLNNGQYYTEFSPTKRTFPQGTFVVPVNQPLRPLINAILERDPRMSNAVLKDERESLEKGHGSRMYEVGAWALPLAYDIDACAAKAMPSVKLQKLDDVAAIAGSLINPEAAAGYLMAYNDDNAIHALLYFFEKGWRVRSARKKFQIEGQKYERGTLLLLGNENPELKPGDLEKCAKKFGVTIRGVNTGLSQKGPDFGGDMFGLLTKPRIAMLAGPAVSSGNLGTIRYMLDVELKLGVALINTDYFNWTDLRPYNVLIVPSSGRGFRNLFNKQVQKKVKTWVEQGGTLIAIGNSAAFLADSSAKMSAVRLRRQILKKLSDYEDAFKKETAARKVSIDSMALWADSAPAAAKSSDKKGGKMNIAALKKRDARQRLFMPRGIIMNVLLDEEHWLNFGLGKSVPAIFYSANAFMSKSPVQTAARFAPAKTLRISGLLWPEARERWQNTAYATRESRGSGQIILFNGEPNFRSYFYGTGRMLINSMLLGPGMGTRQPNIW